MPSDDMKKKKDDLQRLVGDKPKIKIDDFINYGKTQIRSEILSVSPQSLSEIQAVVKGCRELAIRIRAAGATHSWSPLFSDEGQLVMFTKDLKRHDGPQIELLQNPDDDAEKYVTVMTNVTTGELMDFEVSHGVCLPCNVLLQVVTLGGIVSPGCHGVGRDCKTVSDYITAMRIVDSDGELRSYSTKEDGKDMMLAIQANMGLFGIIYDITFDMLNMVIVNSDTRIEPVSRVFYDKEFLKTLFENWSVEIFWFPFNGMSLNEVTESVFEGEIDWGEYEPKDDDVYIRIINKAESAGEVKSRKAYRLQSMREYMQHTFGRLIGNMVVTNPKLTASFGHTQWKFLKAQLDTEETVVQHLPHAIHFRDNIEEIVVQDMEWALDCDKDYKTLMKATQFVIERVKCLATEGKYPMNVAMEMRLTEHSDIYLSPSLAGNPKHGGSGQTLYIEVLSLVGTQGWDDFCNEVTDFWKTLPGARPHWCKEWSNLKGIDSHLKKVYKTQFGQFTKQLEKSKADPDGIFFNDRLESLMFPKGHQGWKALQKKQQSNQDESNKDEKDGEQKKKSKTCALL